MGHRLSDECWWSRVASPTLSAFSEEGELCRMIQQSVAKDDPEPKAISCYGLYLPRLDGMWIRFVDGRPVSSVTTQFLSWCCEELEKLGKKVLLLIWDNASWHVSKEVRRWLGKHNRKVKNSGGEAGVRILSCLLPKQSPWLNAIEPKWVHANGGSWSSTGCSARMSRRQGMRDLWLSASRAPLRCRRSLDHARGTLRQGKMDYPAPPYTR